MTRFISPVGAAVMVAAVFAGAACGEKAAQSTGEARGAEAAAGATKASPAVKTASIPKDACGWIPASEVEQVVGKLSGPAVARGNDCIYPLAAKSEAFASLLAMRKQFRPTADPNDHDFRDEIRISVDLKAESITSDIAFAAVGKMFAKELGNSPSDVRKDPPPAGWDSESGLPYTWVGRIGHISIIVFSPPEVTKETKMAVAAKVRDRIPDLPFPAQNTYQVISLGANGKSPCDLLTKSEAEAVLGTLEVEPYRAVEETSFAYDKGKSCAYFTKGHRAFILTPEWTDGAFTFKLARGIGGLIGSQVPLENADIEGPWDKGALDGATGSLNFLKGDSSLRVDFLTSSADRTGALKLAAQAMQRLVP